MNQKINLFCLLEDIREQLLLELTPDLRHSMKQFAGRTLSASRRFIEEIDGIIKENEAFGDDADELREVIDRWVKEKEGEMA